MRLELANFPVKDVRFGKETGYKSGVLEVAKEELLALVGKNKKIASADLDITFPGEQTRIVRVSDVVEPRVKVSGPGCVFPGIMGPIETVGEGRTHRLPNVTVIASSEYLPKIVGGTEGQNSGIVDTWGPGAQVTPFSSTINIVLILKLIDSVSEVEAHTAIQLAELRVAQRLAETTRDSTPESMDVLDSPQVDPSLPRVVYILGAVTEWQNPHSGVAFYGLPIREALPTFIHPNELFDGVLTTDARRGRGDWNQTWGWMNLPVALRLLMEHGKRVNFLGVILQRTRFETEFGKHVTAASTSQMARLIQADGAIITRVSPSGNNLMDAMLTLQACERKGIKTVFLGPEWGGNEGTEIPLIFQLPEADAMVSTGSMDREIKLPAPTKVIGCEKGKLMATSPVDPLFSPWDELTMSLGNIASGIDWWGNMKLTRKGY